MHLGYIKKFFFYIHGASFSDNFEINFSLVENPIKRHVFFVCVRSMFLCWKLSELVFFIYPRNLIFPKKSLFI